MILRKYTLIDNPSQNLFANQNLCNNVAGCIPFRGRYQQLTTLFAFQNVRTAAWDELLLFEIETICRFGQIVAQCRN